MTTTNRRGGIFGLNPFYNQLAADSFEANGMQINGDGRITGILTVDGSIMLDGMSLGGLALQGTWDADTNTPDLPAMTPENNHFWIVSVSGDTTLGPISDWAVNDWAVYINNGWTKISAGDRSVYSTLDIGDMTLTGSTITTNAPATELTITPTSNSSVNVSTSLKTGQIIGSGADGIQFDTGSGTTTTRMSIRNSGDILIGGGTYTPNGLFDVQGALAITNATEATKYWSMSVDNTSSSNLSIFNGTSERIRVNANGQATLIGSSLSFSNAISGLNFDYQDTTGLAVIGAHHSTADSSIAFYTNTGGGAAAERVRITEDGYLGIGTQTPLSSLHVAGPFDSTPNIAGVHMGVSGNFTTVKISGSTGGFIDFQDAADGNQYAGRIVYTHTDNGMKLYTNGTEKLRLTANGSLGIGVLNPAYMLDLGSNETNNGYAMRMRSNATAQSVRLQFSTSNVSQQNAFIEAGDSQYIALGTTVEACRILSNTNFCIGIQNTTSRLHVKGDEGDSEDVTVTIDTDAPASNNETNDAIVSLIGRGKNFIGADFSQASEIVGEGQLGSASAMVFKTTNSSAVLEEQARFNTNGAFLVQTTSQFNGAPLNVDTGGIGIGNSQTLGQYRRYHIDSSHNLIWTNGTNTPSLTSAGVWTDASDRIFKRDITDLEYGLDEIKKLKPRSYYMKNEEIDDGRHIGFIAQELKEFIPECVFGEEGEMTISYGRITTVLVNAIQELSQKIERLEGDNHANN